MEMHNPAHPGELLREYLPETMTVTEAAERHAPNSFSRAERPGRHQRRYGFAPGCRAHTPGDASGLCGGTGGAGSKLARISDLGCEMERQGTLRGRSDADFTDVPDCRA